MLVDCIFPGNLGRVGFGTDSRWGTQNNERRKAFFVLNSSLLMLITPKTHVAPWRGCKEREGHFKIQT
jgi:hypothetical protein